MEAVMDFIQMLMANWEVIVASLVMIVNGLIAIALLIPGDQPERALQGVVDFLAKFSRK